MSTSTVTLPNKASLRFAFCLCDGVTLSDFVPPAELLAGMAQSRMGQEPRLDLQFDYLAVKKGPVIPFMGHVVPHIIANKSYQEAMTEEYDVLWVPAGPPPNRETGKDEVPSEEIEFVRAKAGKAKYVASVCGGAAVLARAGVLTGKRATTNKAFFTAIQKMTESCNVEWVPKARYVIDGNIWTSSGVTAGEDMALAFIEHLVGKEWADDIRNVAEVRRAERDDDPFAAIFGLV